MHSPWKLPCIASGIGGKQSDGTTIYMEQSDIPSKLGPNELENEFGLRFFPPGKIRAGVQNHSGPEPKIIFQSHFHPQNRFVG
jgi:hypothetical protein